MHSVAVLDAVDRRKDKFAKFGITKMLEEALRKGNPLWNLRLIGSQPLSRSFLAGELIQVFFGCDVATVSRASALMSDFQRDLQSYFTQLLIYAEKPAFDTRGTVEKFSSKITQFLELISLQVSKNNASSRPDPSLAGLFVSELLHGDRNVTPPEICQELLDIFLRTFDDSISLCLWVLRFLGDNPRLLPRVQAEMKLEPTSLSSSFLFNCTMEAMRHTGIATSFIRTRTVRQSPPPPPLEVISFPLSFHPRLSSRLCLC